MIPIFVISLSDCFDRRNLIKGGLQDLNLSFEFIDAVDGRFGLSSEFDHLIDRQNSKRNGIEGQLSDAEYACALSHCKVYERVVQEGIDWALVLEDDAIPTPELHQYLFEPENYCDSHITQLQFTATRVRMMGSKKLFGKYRSYLRSVHFTSHSTAGYVISKFGANFMLNHCLPIRAVADWPNCVDDLVLADRFRVVFPHIVKVPPASIGRSTITNYDSINETKKRRLFGIYVPPINIILRSLARSPFKLLTRKL